MKSGKPTVVVVGGGYGGVAVALGVDDRVDLQLEIEAVVNT
jgi:NADH dehydrogenase FAD-containing subunit